MSEFHTKVAGLRQPGNGGPGSGIGHGLLPVHHVQSPCLRECVQSPPGQDLVHCGRHVLEGRQDQRCPLVCVGGPVLGPTLPLSAAQLRVCHASQRQREGIWRSVLQRLGSPVNQSDFPNIDWSAVRVHSCGRAQP